jgi:hypothetical protein
MDAMTENFEHQLATENPDQLELFADESEYVESTFEEQYENEQFAQDGEFENMSAADMM